MRLRSFILVALATALVAAPAGYLIADNQVGTARSAGGAAVDSTDGLTVEEMRDLGISEAAIERVLSWREDSAKMDRLEAEGAPSLNVIPEPMPAETAEWCRKGPPFDSEMTDLARQCAAILLAAEGRLEGGTYTDEALSAAVQRAEATR